MSGRSDGARRRWRSGPGMAVAVGAGLALLIGLGTWQLDRLAWKERLIAERSERLAAPVVELPVTAPDWQAFDLRRVAVGGVFRPDLGQRFGLEARGGRPGHRLLVPLLRPDGSAVLVDRGWVPADEDAHGEGSPAGGALEVVGIARHRADDRPGWLTPANEPAAGRWYWYDMAALETALGLDLLPVVVEEAGADATRGRRLVELPNNHLQYAITWYALAAALLGVYLAYSLRSGRSGG